MSNHNFEDRFFKTRRILELTIFFFLAFSLLSFTHSDFVPITKKVIYNINPNIAVDSYVLDRTPLITAKDIDMFRYKIPKERLDLLWKLNLPYFKNKSDDLPRTITAFEDVPFVKSLKGYVGNNKDRANILEIVGDDKNCYLNNYNLICNFDKDLR